jgi:hypothetical protein
MEAKRCGFAASARAELAVRPRGRGYMYQVPLYHHCTTQLKTTSQPGHFRSIFLIFLPVVPHACNPPCACNQSGPVPAMVPLAMMAFGAAVLDIVYV